jgi:cytoskeletal protein RodZ
MDVSGCLRSARERAGLSIDEVSARTKIKPVFLQAIERADFERLPGEFFARAFLRTYARELHLPPDEIVDAYDARFAPVSGDPQLPASVTDGDKREGGSRRRLDLSSRPAIGFWPVAALVAVMVLLASLVNRAPQNGSDPSRPVGTTGVTGTAPAPPAARQKAAAPEKLTIEIRPSRVIWVAGAADGERVIYRLVGPGERVGAEARGELWFRVGDAGAFDYSINGVPGKPIGGPGEVREFRITLDNVRTFYR